ncbi:MAG: beta-galactosidase [Candidatus Moranbacteria bacterium]|jgi:hypothetical protein|nr:beta-galactosidase [Candidatus Moranbacteria bacterium]MDX9855679.1 beta-galactosidase [Candidatus Moranbacteria bacterium]
MLKIFLKSIAVAVSAITVATIIFFIYFNLPTENIIEKADIGVTFSLRYSQDIGLDWKENYLAMLDDLKIKKIRIPVYWDLVEKEKDQYDFSDIDWQLEEAQKRGAEIILVVGQKVPRWPECHIPRWIGENSSEVRENEKLKDEEILEFVGDVVKRYKNHEAIKYWQVENEPFLAFGDCSRPTIGAEMLDKEIAVVKSTDSSRQVIVTDSGELSTWIPAAKRADVFGTTMYRNVYKEGWGYYVYPIGPRFFLTKRWFIEKFAGQEDAIVIELQGEPWVAGWTTNQPLEEQFKSMNAEKLSENILYAQKSGFDTIYIWGVEWWYWLKTEKDLPEIWNMMKGIINKNQK